jgi:predicted HAD superfamily hydrolase
MMNRKYYSFDVFDTVISRITATPVGIFSLIQHKLHQINYPIDLPDELLKKFAEIRISAEQTVRKNSTNEEITLDEIYRYIGFTYRISEDDVKKLIEIEKNVEIQSVFGIPSVIGKINELREKGNKIIFLSDSYLPYDIIHQMLESVGAIKANDELFVSSKQGVTKETGNLFRYILNNYHCLPGDIFHIGDNKKSDFLIPHKMGIQCDQFIGSQLAPYEHLILDSIDNENYNLQGQLLSGFCRKVRLTNVDYVNKEDITLYNIGTKIAGPILLGYVIWILKTAKQRKVKTIYFIARDGQILLQIAQKIQNKVAPDIELRYLYGSRQAWHLPAMNSIGEREFNWIFEADPFLTIDIIARRLELSPILIIDELKRISDKQWTSHQKLTHSDIQQLKRVLCETHLLKRILENANKNREALIEYLKQENLWENNSWILVDLGWKGRLQDSLQNIFHFSGKNQSIYGLYFGLIDTHTSKNKKAYFFYPGCNVPNQDIGNKFVNFLEIFTAADHGGTLSYYFDSITHSWKPKLTETNNSDVIRWGLDPLRNGLTKYIEEITEYLDCFAIDENNFFTELSFNIMKNTLNHPDLQDAKMLGKFPFSSDQAGSHVRQFAPPINLKKFLILTFRNTINPVEITYWKNGSVIQSDKGIQFLELLRVFFSKFKRGLILKIKRRGSE